MSLTDALTYLRAMDPGARLVGPIGAEPVDRVLIGGIALDSAQAVPGDLFAGLPGAHHHGAHYAPEAAVLMPWMSAAAAAGRTDRAVDDLALGTRLSKRGAAAGQRRLDRVRPGSRGALFSLGRSGVEAGALLGEAVAVSAFGLLPLAVVMLQMRAFYALADARTRQ